MNALNKSYGKLLQGNYLEYAPEAFNHDGKDYMHPTAADYKMIGFLPIVKTNPSEPAPAGKHYAGDGWEATANTIVYKWRLVDDPPPPPRTFSKMKIVAALIEIDAWNETKAWIQANGLYDLYLAAQDFAEDNEHFENGKAALQMALHLTDEQVEQILSSSVL